jgi:hypothetical protein
MVLQLPLRAPFPACDADLLRLADTIGGGHARLLAQLYDLDSTCGQSPVEHRKENIRVSAKLAVLESETANKFEGTL